MKPLKYLRQQVLHILQLYDMVYLRMIDEGSNNSLTVIFDHQTHSSKLKNLNHSFKAQRLKAAWSFCPETWELAVKISL